MRGSNLAFWVQMFSQQTHSGSNTEKTTIVILIVISLQTCMVFTDFTTLFCIYYISLLKPYDDALHGGQIKCKPHSQISFKITSNLVLVKISETITASSCYHITYSVDTMDCQCMKMSCAKTQNVFFCAPQMEKNNIRVWKDMKVKKSSFFG